MSARESTAPWGHMARSPNYPVSHGEKHDKLCITVTGAYSPPMMSCWCRCKKCWDVATQRCVCKSCPCPSSREGLGPIFIEGTLLPPVERPSKRTAGRDSTTAHPQTPSTAKRSGKPAQAGRDETGRYARKRKIGQP